MRECYKDFAHGHMKLETTQVQAEYKGETFTCDKTIYNCQLCDFEIHLDWMKDKMQKDLEAAYRKKHAL